MSRRRVDRLVYSIIIVSIFLINFLLGPKQHIEGQLER